MKAKKSRTALVVWSFIGLAGLWFLLKIGQSTKELLRPDKCWFETSAPIKPDIRIVVGRVDNDTFYIYRER